MALSASFWAARPAFWSSVDVLSRTAGHRTPDTGHPYRGVSVSSEPLTDLADHRITRTKHLAHPCPVGQDYGANPLPLPTTNSAIHIGPKVTNGTGRDNRTTLPPNVDPQLAKGTITAQTVRPSKVQVQPLAWCFDSQG